jgi:hypothetical protein
LGYTVEVPAGWRVDADPAPDRKPATSSFFIGVDRPQTEGRPPGAVLSIGRFMRRRADIPGGPAQYKAYEEGFLKPTIRLFGDDAPTAAMKSYTRKDAAGTAFRTENAYYLVECRSTAENAALCRAALDHAVSTFKPPVL